MASPRIPSGALGVSYIILFRVCLKTSLLEKNDNGGEVNYAKIVTSQLFVASSNTAKLLQSIEKALHKMSFFVVIVVAFPGVNSVIFGWNTVASSM